MLGKLGYSLEGVIISFERRMNGDCQVSWDNGDVTTELLSHLTICDTYA